MLDHYMVFLDIDGVLNVGPCDHGKLEHELVANVTRLPGRPRIVFNTAWNIEPTERIRKRLQNVCRFDGRFEWDQTDSTQGGSQPIVKYLDDNGLHGVPFIAIDDSSKYRASMWGRVTLCDPWKGFDGDRYNHALGTLRMLEKGDAREERMRAVSTLLGSARRVQGAGWLSPSQKDTFVLEDIKMAKDILLNRDC